jgi:hypothetical protein
MDGVLICEFCGGMVTNPTMPHKCGGGPVFVEPTYQWEVIIGDEQGIVCKFVTMPPNRFQRFMYKFLLDWKVNVF